MLNALLQGLQSVRIFKERQSSRWLLQLFAEFSVEDWQAIGKPVRAMPHKLLTTYSEIDITARLSVKTILTNIHTAFPDLIGSTWTSLKPTDRRTLNGLFGGSGSLLDKFILDATKKPALIRASLDVRSPSPTSTTVNTPAISPKSMIARAKRSSIARSTTSVDSSSSMYASSMGSSELIDRSPGKLFVSSSAASQLGDTIQRARSGSKGSLNGFGSTTQSTVNSKLSAAYEDSDTDWVTDSEVLRSPTESEMSSL
ncbi:hypothetical protein BC829DRAFT_108913 [Chytridium lagenaria]|nr:hypothetical protein BC829DRAFT_108913 [Chytridium lagenaria]